MLIHRGLCVLFNGASLLVDRSAGEDDIDDLPLPRAGPPTDLLGGTIAAGGENNGGTAAGQQALLVDPMAWRKYCSLTELYGFLGARLPAT